MNRALAPRTVARWSLRLRGRLTARGRPRAAELASGREGRGSSFRTGQYLQRACALDRHFSACFVDRDMNAKGARARSMATSQCTTDAPWSVGHLGPQAGKEKLRVSHHAKDQSDDRDRRKHSDHADCGPRPTSPDRNRRAGEVLVLREELTERSQPSAKPVAPLHDHRHGLSGRNHVPTHHTRLS